ncbi:MAG: divergent polysaccharide deacetylase family protein [Devosia sp.]
MAEDLSAPLGRKRAAAKPGKSLDLKPTSLPLARIAFGVAALIVVGAGARVLLVNDPMGGRPVTTIDVNAGGANAIADTVAPTGSVTITAGPEVPAANLGVTIVGDDVPDGDPQAMGLETANADGLLPDLLEETEHGPIPRIAATGETPFDAYARPSLTPGTADGKKLIAIVVTGLGLNETGTANAIDTLPDAITLAFAPYGKSLNRTVASARAGGHEILLEMPLEPFDYPDSDPGPDTLLTGQAPRDNLDKLFTVMAKFGGYVGLINHMGARFTASTADFAPVMEELGARGLGYLDDGSSNRSVATQLAAANRVAFGRADMMLDQNPSRSAILEQLAELEARATDNGQAIGVISALPISVQTVAEWASSVEGQGFAIVPVSALMKAGL